MLRDDNLHTQEEQIKKKKNTGSRPFNASGCCSDLLSHVCSGAVCAESHPNVSVQNLHSSYNFLSMLSVIGNRKPVITCLLFQAAGQLVAQVVAVVVLQLMSDYIKLTPQLKNKTGTFILNEMVLK